MSTATPSTRARIPKGTREASSVNEPTDDDDDVSPTRIRVGLGIVAAVLVITVGVLTKVEEPAARLLFMAILVIGLFQTWRIFRKHRR